MRKGTLQIRVMAATALWLAPTLSTTGCLFQKKPRAYVPPAVRPPARVDPGQPPLLDPAPEVAIAVVELPDFRPATLSPLPPWVPQPVPAGPRPPVARAPKPTLPAPDAPPTLPRITQILTAQQIRENNQQLDEYLNFVTEALNKAGKRNLTAEQRGIAEQIKTFQKQAVQAREDDLVTAVNYARRADLLAKDLLSRLP
jgi:hypothetical protein